MKNFDEKTEVHNNLTEMRRQFDQTRTLANKREKELKILQVFLGYEILSIKKYSDFWYHFLFRKKVIN